MAAAALHSVSLADASLARTTAIAAAGALKGTNAAKAMAAAQDFESVFLNSMFGQMFTAIGGEGPFGGGGGTGVWRSFLAEQYAKNFAENGGIGIARQVYGTLLAQQESAAPAGSHKIR
jgi:Rod binding domain-containing protein